MAANFAFESTGKYIQSPGESKVFARKKLKIKTRPTRRLAPAQRRSERTLFLSSQSTSSARHSVSMDGFSARISEDFWRSADHGESFTR
jgi:hypothetical protein